VVAADGGPAGEDVEGVEQDFHEGHSVRNRSRAARR
jgi:hypothetical protein